ncbi:MAG: ATP-binding protein [Bdellovibrionota bacterium]
MTERAAPQSGSLVPLRERFSDLLSWPQVDLGLLVAATTFSFPAAFALAGHLVLWRPAIAPYVDLYYLRGFLVFLWSFAAWWVLMFAWGLWLRRSYKKYAPYRHATLYSWFWGWAGVAYSIGQFTTPAWLIFIGLAIVAVIFVPFREVLIAYSSAIGGLLLSAALEAAGILRYAPLFHSSPFQGGKLSGWWGWITGVSALLFSATVFLAVSLLVARWKDRETALALAHDRLATLNNELERRVEDRSRDLLAVQERLQESQKMEAIGRLAGGVAHDFNNLLMVISGYADVLARRMRLERTTPWELGEIKKASERATSLVQQLLAYSRRQILKLRVIELNSLVREIERMLPRLLGEDIQMEIHLPANPISVKADPTQLHQVLLNLAVNARDAMPLGGMLAITLSTVEFEREQDIGGNLMPAGSYAVIEVKDTGIGMDAETKARIFEPFYTTKGLGKGTGLGLSTVHGIVTQSGGAIAVETAPGRGTVFRVFLPHAGTLTSIEDVSVAISPLRVSVSRTVLLVEDDSALRTFLRKAMEDAGLEVFEASNAAEALEISQNRKQSIDLLITDVVLPKLSGRELAEELALVHPETQVLFMSGYTDDQILLRGVSAREVRFLQKPFAIYDLIAKVGEILELEMKAANA